MGLERGKFTLLCNEKRNSTTYAWAQQRDRLYQWNVKNGVNETGNERREQKLRRERCERGCAFFCWNPSRACWARELDAGEKGRDIARSCLSSRCSLCKCLVMGQLYYTCDEKQSVRRGGERVAKLWGGQVCD